MKKIKQMYLQVYFQKVTCWKYITKALVNFKSTYVTYKKIMKHNIQMDTCEPSFLLNIKTKTLPIWLKQCFPVSGDSVPLPSWDMQQ